MGTGRGLWQPGEPGRLGYGRLAPWAGGLGFRQGRRWAWLLLQPEGPGTERGSPGPAENCNPAWAPGMAQGPNYLPLWRIPLSIFMLALCLPFSPRCYLCWPPLQDNAEFTILLCKQADVNLSCYVKKFILNQHSRKRRAWLLELEMYI